MISIVLFLICSMVLGCDTSDTEQSSLSDVGGETQTSDTEKSSSPDDTYENQDSQTDEDTSQGSSDNDVESTWEYTLAKINAGGYVSNDDKTIKQFAKLLDSIEVKTKNSRKEISDMTVKAQEILKDEGIEVELLELTRNLDKSMPDESKDLSYSSITAAYTVLLINQK